VPVALLAHGDDLVAVTEDGQIVRMHRGTGAAISSYLTGLLIRDVAMDDGCLLMGADDQLTHLLDAYPDVADLLRVSRPEKASSVSFEP
jgi:hypothetical protein